PGEGGISGFKSCCAIAVLAAISKIAPIVATCPNCTEYLLLKRRRQPFRCATCDAMSWNYRLVCESSLLTPENLTSGRPVLRASPVRKSEIILSRGTSSHGPTFWRG